jgi:hypothetical protein
VVFEQTLVLKVFTDMEAVRVVFHLSQHHETLRIFAISFDIIFFLFSTNFMYSKKCGYRNTDPHQRKKPDPHRTVKPDSDPSQNEKPEAKPRAVEAFVEP